MTQLAYLILTGDHDLSLPPSISLVEVTTSTSATSMPHSQHRRSSSRGSVRGFIPPEETLVASLTHPVARGRSPRPLPGQPVPMMKHQPLQQQCEAKEANGGNSSREGSSTESQSHMKVSNSLIYTIYPSLYIDAVCSIITHVHILYVSACTYMYVSTCTFIKGVVICTCTII